jgi:hypothetical protein
MFGFMSDLPEQMPESFISLLILDVVDSLARWKSEPSQTNGRDLIRTTFAAVEGTAWHYKEHITGVARDIDILAPEEEIALSETGYMVASDGGIQTQIRFVPLPALIRAISRIASRIDPSFQVDFGQVGWNQLRLAIGIRNRITHPKQSSDMLVSQIDVASAQAALHWLLETVTSGMGVANQAFQLHNKLLRQLISELEHGDPEAWREYRVVEAELSR